MEKLLIVGLGDVAQRALPELLSHYEVTVLSRSAYLGDWAASLRHVAANLDEWTLSAQQQSALAQPFDAVLYTVPPLLRADSGTVDVRLCALLNFWQQQGVAPKPDDLAAGFGQPLDLGAGGGQVAGVRVGHGLDPDRMVRAKRQLAEPDGPGRSSGGSGGGELGHGWPGDLWRGWRKKA